MSSDDMTFFNTHAPIASKPKPSTAYYFSLYRIWTDYNKFIVASVGDRLANDCIQDFFILMTAIKQHNYQIDLTLDN